MLTGVQFHVELEDELPISIVRKGDDTIAVVRDNQLNSLFLPFSLRACVIQRVENCSELHTVRENGALEIVSREWCNRVKLRVGLTTSQVRTHWLLLKTEGMSVATHCFEGTEEGVRDVVIWLESTLLDSSYEIWLVSEPQVCCESVSQEVGTMRCVDENEFPNERVVFGDSVADVALYIEDFLRSFFIHGSTLPTAVFWPSQLTFPVNVHCSNNELRVLEHRALLLPVRPLLLTSMRIKDWSTAKGLNRAPVNGVPRNNQQWEKHLVQNVHSAIKDIAPVPGGERRLISGSYDYYHYLVDGFKDSGWGCAYRSLQTILSWFQYEGLVDVPMPTIREIQEVLSLKDADKMGRRDFVGSKDWIGSFEIMIALQHYVPGVECTIRRMESGADLENDPTVQQLLLRHFSGKRACPVMIGGSNYAHTIVGVDINPSTMEARYLVVDPHYASNETSAKTVVCKGYVGWKEAGKFFESTSWYNLCVPQVAAFDPR